MMMKVKLIFRGAWNSLMNTEQNIVHKMDFTDVIDFIHSCKNQEKTVLSVLF